MVSRLLLNPTPLTVTHPLDLAFPIRIHCFENVNVLIFFVAINEYDQVLYEDECVVSKPLLFPLFS